MGGAAGQGECQVSSCVRGYHVDVRASLITQLVKNLQYRRPWVDSRVGKIPRIWEAGLGGLESKVSFLALPGTSHGTGAIGLGTRERQTSAQR